MIEYDFLIENVFIVDGKNPRRKGSITISGELIATIGDVKGDAKRTIDGRGLTALPGFIDAHSHSDRNILFYPLAQSHVMQGVSTFVGGNCGNSAAPLCDKIEVARTLGPAGVDYLFELEPFMFRPSKHLFPRELINAMMEENYGWTINWRTMGEFFQRVRKEGISLNYAPLVGHGNIRWIVLGEDYERLATQAEVGEMGDILYRAMDDGCLGMSAGLDFEPETFADEREHLALVSIVKEYDGVYAPHYRCHWRGGRIWPVEQDQQPRIKGIVEVLDIAKKTGCRIHLAHLFTGFEVRHTPHSNLQVALGQATLDVIDGYQSKGVDISFDVTPYNAEGRTWPLYSRLSPWLRLLGSKRRLSEWLRVEDFRSLVASKLPHRDWEQGVKIFKHNNQSYEDREIIEIARNLGRTPLDTYFDLLVEDPDSMGWTPDFRGSEVYVRRFFKHPFSMVGCDTRAYDKRRRQKGPPWSIPGINDYAAYPSFLTRYVGRGKFFTLEEAVIKTSTLPAKVYNIRGRGVLEEGGFADITLVDLSKLGVTGDLLEPRRFPRGIEYLFVNGNLVVDEARHTGKRPGKILLREL